jgi:hypothetical protein
MHAPSRRGGDNEWPLWVGIIGDLVVPRHDAGVQQRVVEREDITTSSSMPCSSRRDTNCASKFQCPGGVIDSARYAAKLIASDLLFAVRSAGGRRRESPSSVRTAFRSYAAHASNMHVCAMDKARAIIGGPIVDSRVPCNRASFHWTTTSLTRGFEMAAPAIPRPTGISCAAIVTRDSAVNLPLVNSHTRPRRVGRRPMTPTRIPLFSDLDPSGPAEIWLPRRRV